MMRYPITEQETVQAMAVTSMLLAWIQLNLGSDASNVEKIENLLRLLTKMFQTCGEPMFMTSWRILWYCATTALIQCEQTHFPELPVETPTQLVIPREMLSFSQLTRADWEPMSRYWFRLKRH